MGSDKLFQNGYFTANTADIHQTTGDRRREFLAAGDERRDRVRFIVREIDSSRCRGHLVTRAGVLESPLFLEPLLVRSDPTGARAFRRLRVCGGGERREVGSVGRMADWGSRI